MQQHSSEYWAAHFRKLIAERPDIQQALDEEEQQPASQPIRFSGMTQPLLLRWQDAILSAGKAKLNEK